MMANGPFIVGLGTALPPVAIAQSEAAARAQAYCGDGPAGRLLTALYRRSGVKSRHSVLLAGNGIGGVHQDFLPPPTTGEDRGPTTAERMDRYAATATELAREAARAALANARTQPAQITHLVTASCTGFAAPGFDVELIDRLGLSRAVARTHVGFMGCHAALNALRVAKAFAQADPTAHVLLCAAELCSLHFAYGDDAQEMVANALFADGAAGSVIQASPAATRPVLQIADTASHVLVGTADAMSWRIGDHGFRMTLSPGVPRLIESYLPGWIGGWLATHGLGVADVSGWAVHPGGPRILESVGSSLGLADGALEASRQVLTRCGNMSSPTVLFILKRLREQAVDGPCVALAFGPGLTIEASLLLLR